MHEILSQNICEVSQSTEIDIRSLLLLLLLLSCTSRRQLVGQQALAYKHQ